MKNCNIVRPTWPCVMNEPLFLWQGPQEEEETAFFVAESVTVPSVKVVYSEPEALQLGYQVSAPV
eukprot:COSAG04_NODE_8970_length_911_cov_1.043103_1_plen_64_part_10